MQSASKGMCQVLTIGNEMESGAKDICQISGIVTEIKSVQNGICQGNDNGTVKTNSKKKTANKCIVKKKESKRKTGTKVFANEPCNW